MNKLLLILASCAFATSTPAATIQFNLIGKGGPGLLTTNEPTPPIGGSGGELGAGITFDDVSRSLSMFVGWGSTQGFTDLSSASNNSHLHGPTTNNNGNDGIGDWRQTASVLFSLTRSSNLATGGIINQAVTLTPAQQVDLFNGKLYINLHTVNNCGGEINGFLTPVPEPTASLLGLGTLGLLAMRRRR